MSEGSVLDQLEAIITANLPAGTSVADALAFYDAASLSIAILDNGKVESRCYSNSGYNEETVYQAASISKAINALGVMRLVEQGVLKLDDTIKDLLPEDLLNAIVGGSPEGHRPLVEAITVKQLISHTAGLNVSGIFGNHTDATPTMLETILGKGPASTERIRQVEFPGAKFSYSGGGTTVLQACMEAKTGKKYSDLMHELVLDPLEMKRSFYGKLPPTEKNAASVYLTPELPFSIKHFVFSTEAAAGLWTTPTDLLKAAAAVQHSLQSDDNSGLLKQETAKLMLTEVDSNMCLGWIVAKGDDKAPTTFMHSGSNSPGYMCDLRGFSDHWGNPRAPKNAAMAVMTNSNNGFDSCNRAMMAVCHIKGWYDAGIKAKTSPVPFEVTPDQSGNLWKGWAGTWADDKKNEYQLKEDENGLPVLSYNGVGKMRLMPVVTIESKTDDGFNFFVLERTAMVIKLDESDGKKTLILGKLEAGDMLMLNKI